MKKLTLACILLTANVSYAETYIPMISASDINGVIKSASVNCQSLGGQIIKSTESFTFAWYGTASAHICQVGQKKSKSEEVIYIPAIRMSGDWIGETFMAGYEECESYGGKIVKSSPVAQRSGEQHWAEAYLCKVIL